LKYLNVDVLCELLGKMINDLAQLGYYLKQMADYGTDLHHGGADVEIQVHCIARG